MIKREVKEKGKGLILLFILVFLLADIVIVAATADVAYVYKKTFKVDNNVISVFNNLGLSVDLISDSQIPTTNFNNYKIIFVGDERFRNANKIPIDKKPSVIANYYFGKEFGLTDSDGISKLASNAPLSVKKSSSVIQVYTKAKFPNGVSIPYYYLDDKNKAPGMQTVARTYTGNKNSYDFGDVISYANAGTHLINGKTTLGKICFFGIIESKYWTPAAKNMFIDCVNYVGMTCQSDDDCPDGEIGELYCSDSGIYQDIREFHCENPGTVQSQCVDSIIHDLIENCGSDYCESWQDDYCKSGDVYKNRICYDKGCENASCFSLLNIEEQIVDDCTGDEICLNGNCVIIECYNNTDCDDSNDYTIDTCIFPGTPESYCTHEPVECLQDSDCTADYYSDNYCMNNSIYRDFHDFSCVGGLCQEQITQELVQECSDLCIDGQCREITCKKNSDCGINGFSGWKYCHNGNSYEDFISFLCYNPGTINSYCVNYTLPILQEYCDFDCVSGECIACYNNLSCGINGFIGNKYCIGNDVYQNYKQFECINPATPDSDCLSSVFPKFIEPCADICINGQCHDIECYNDTECNDFNVYTIDKCINPATINSYCSHAPINCLNNEDCGITGFIGNEFCFENDVFKNYQNATCVNPGTVLSYCDVSIIPKFLIDCGDDYCGNWSDNYCERGDVYHSRVCYDKSCNNGSCASSAFVEEVLVQECEYGCYLGECLPECDENSDCGIPTSEIFCNGSNLVNRTTLPVCVQGECGIEIIENITVCEFGCQNASCLPGIHDVALIDFPHSIGGVGIKQDSVYINENPAQLICNQNYKVLIKVKNQGNFSENITFNGEIDGLLFNHIPVNNTVPGYISPTPKEKTINLSLPAGFYNITVNAIVPIDDFPLNNIARRQIEVICPECFTNEDCGSQTSELICIEKNITNKTITPTCQNGSCVNITTYGFIEYCEYGCLDGECICPLCGNGITEVGEECDDGNLINNDACKNNCTLNICGDGVLFVGVEECDDGNLVNGDGCNDNCEIEIIICHNDSQCGTDAWITDYYCNLDEDAYRDYQNYTCSFPGTINSSCSSSVSNILVGDCLLGCLNGKCLGCVLI